MKHLFVATMLLVPAPALAQSADVDASGEDVVVTGSRVGERTVTT